MTVPRPVFLVNYEGVDISDEIGPMVVSAEFTDHLKAQSDELSLTLENRDGRWLEGWWPAKGDQISLRFGYAHEALVDAGTFRIDEPEVSIAADTITLRALAAPATAPYRTKQNRAFEAQDLRQLMEQLARELELELVGDVLPLRFQRLTQNGETTMAFIRKVCEAYGYAFSIRPPKLVVWPILKLENLPTSLKFRRRDLLPGSAHFKAATANTYIACEVSFLDPATKKLTKVRVEAKFARTRTVVTTGDDLRGVPTIPSRNLRVGTNGEDVRRWQTFLSERGHSPGPIDGIFGPLTRNGTIAFQRSSSIAADGVAGPETFRVAIEQGFGTIAPVEPGLRVEPAGAVLRKEIRVESVEQAEAQARALLDAANRLRATGSFSVRGNGLVIAGANVELLDIGRLSGKYSIQSSRHHASRSGGYTTDCEVSVV